MMDLSDLVVESIEVVSAGSLDSTAYGHGMPELAASRARGAPSEFPPEDWDSAET